MTKEILWLLFQKTGKIEYYLKYKNKQKEVAESDKESRRNHR